jgi:anti-sigma factor RsiW
MWRAFRRSEKDECSKTRELLSGYMDQRLNPEEVAHVEGHLRTCPGCREELDSLRATVALLHRLPEVTPSRSFAVAPVRPLPGRRALPALRFATAGVVLLLVLAFAVDQTNVVERKGHTGSYFSSAAISEGDEAYWTVPGVRNTVDPPTGTPVNLVVPDQTDNVYTAVNSLVTAGVLYGSVVSSPDEVPQVVLEEDEEGAIVSATTAQAFLVVAQASDNADGGTTHFSINGEDSKGVVDGQNGALLNMVLAGSDNNVLYSFDLNGARREVKAARDNDWLRPLQYGLIGLVAVLGGATAALWLRQRRQRVVGVSKSQN